MSKATSMLPKIIRLIWKFYATFLVSTERVLRYFPSKWHKFLKILSKIREQIMLKVLWLRIGLYQLFLLFESVSRQTWNLGMIAKTTLGSDYEIFTRSYWFLRFPTFTFAQVLDYYNWTWLSHLSLKILSMLHQKITP